MSWDSGNLLAVVSGLPLSYYRHEKLSIYRLLADSLSFPSYHPNGGLWRLIELQAIPVNMSKYMCNLINTKYGMNNGNR